MDRMQRRNLILSSGGGLGAWQAGALNAMARTDPCLYACVAGTSVGALNAALLCQAPVSRTREGVEAVASLWSEGHGNPLPSHWRIMASVLCCGPCTSSALNGGSLESLADCVDWQAVARSDRLLYIGVFDASTVRCEYHTNGRTCMHCRRQHTPEELRRYVVASMSVPALFPAVKIGDQTYVDGGVAHYVPRVTFPVSLPVDVVCTDPVDCRPEQSSGDLILPLRLYATINCMSSRMAQSDLRWVKSKYTATIYRPRQMSGEFSILSFTKEKAKRLYRMGFKEVASAKRPINIL
jgi:hypothetical protein